MEWSISFQFSSTPRQMWQGESSSYHHTKISFMVKLHWMIIDSSWLLLSAYVYLVLCINCRPCCCPYVHSWDAKPPLQLYMLPTVSHLAMPFRGLQLHMTLYWQYTCLLYSNTSLWQKKPNITVQANWPQDPDPGRAQRSIWCNSSISIRPAPYDPIA